MPYSLLLISSVHATQAMTAYRTASRLFPGLHLAVLGMGMEYSQMGNLQVKILHPHIPATSSLGNV